MSLQTFIEAMPKVDLHVHLEGSIDVQRLLLIAEQYDVPETLKHYDDWVALLGKPEYGRLQDLIRTVNSWVREADDLSRMIYDLGTKLHKQGVRYAEVGVCPAYYPEIGSNIEGFFAGLNDGRERAQKAWGIQMAWVYETQREDVRRVEELTRWVNLIPAHRANVVGFGLTGKDDGQPIGQYERAFRSLEKRPLARVVRVGELTGMAGSKAAIEGLHPSRLIDGRGIQDDEQAVSQLHEDGACLLYSPTRALKHKWAPSGELPLRRLVDMGVAVVLGADYPTLYHTDLNTEYRLAVEQGGLTVDQLIEVAGNAIAHSMLPEAELGQFNTELREQWAALKAEHLP